MKPWVKLYREERGSFVALPLMARALFGQVLKLVEDDGVIECGRLEPAKYIARAMGADRSDRKQLARLLPLLAEEGCLVFETDGTLHRIRVPGFQQHQTGTKAAGPGTTRAPLVSDTSTTGAHVEHSKSTTGAPLEHMSSTTSEDNPTKPLRPPPQIRVEKSRKEESRRRVDARARDPVTTFEIFQEALSRLRQSHGGGPFKAGVAAYRHVEDVCAVVDEEARRQNAEPREVVDKILSHWAMDPWVVANGFPLGQLAKDPGRWLVAPKPKRGTVAQARSHEDFEDAPPLEEQLRQQGLM